MGKTKTDHFGLEGLKVYQVARAFRNKMYQVADKLPEKEKYALTCQVRQAAISVTNNIAEGYGRFTWQDTTHFFHIARGSVSERIDDLNICLDQKYYPAAFLQDLKEEAISVMQLINGYIRYLQQSKRPQENVPRAAPGESLSKYPIPNIESQ